MFGTSPAFPDAGFFPCLAAAFYFPYGLYGLGLCIGALALLILMVMRMGYSEGGEYDRRRNLVYSNKGTYGTAGFMSRKELTEVLDLVPDIRKHSGMRPIWRVSFSTATTPTPTGRRAASTMMTSRPCASPSMGRPATVNPAAPARTAFSTSSAATGTTRGRRART